MIVESAVVRGDILCFAGIVLHIPLLLECLQLEERDAGAAGTPLSQHMDELLSVFRFVPNLGTAVGEGALVERVALADDLSGHLEHSLDRERLRRHESEKVDDVDWELTTIELLHNCLFLLFDSLDLVLREGRVPCCEVERTEQLLHRNLANLFLDKVVDQNGNHFFVKSRLQQFWDFTLKHVHEGAWRHARGRLALVLDQLFRLLVLSPQLVADHTNVLLSIFELHIGEEFDRRAFLVFRAKGLRGQANVGEEFEGLDLLFAVCILLDPLQEHVPLFRGDVTADFSKHGHDLLESHFQVTRGTECQLDLILNVASLLDNLGSNMAHIVVLGTHYLLGEHVAAS